MSRLKSIFSTLKAHSNQIGVVGAMSRGAQHVLWKSGLSHRNACFWLRDPRTGHFLLARLRSSDVNNYLQIYKENEFAPLHQVLSGASVIIDCGAYVGYASHYFLSRYPKCRVVSAEPFPEHFKLLKKNLSRFKSRSKLLNAAVWPKKTALKFSTVEEGAEWGISLGESAPGQESDVPAVTVPELIEMTGSSRIDLLKMDVEGAEKNLFSDPDCGKWIAQCRNIAIELHGNEASEIFFRALSGFQYDKVVSGELIILTNIRPN